MLTNNRGGTIDGNDSTALKINTGANSITNFGLIEGTSSGGTIIESTVYNLGTLAAIGGKLVVNGAVIGNNGAVNINAGTAEFTSTITENVTFTGATGVLELGQSQTYHGIVFGFSKTGTTSLDLRDIVFGVSTKAVYGGNASFGTLTVSDGSHVAHIRLSGDYRASKFTVSGDGRGGTVVVDPAAAAAAQRFIAASSAMPAAPAPSHAPAHEAWRATAPMLARPGGSSAGSIRLSSCA
jgi:hypothetical protein